MGSHRLPRGIQRTLFLVLLASVLRALEQLGPRGPARSSCLGCRERRLRWLRYLGPSSTRVMKGSVELWCRSTPYVELSKNRGPWCRPRMVGLSGEGHPGNVQQFLQKQPHKPKPESKTPAPKSRKCPNVRHTYIYICARNLYV